MLRALGLSPLLLTAAAQAQVVLHGRVVDSASHAPVEHAWVQAKEKCDVNNLPDLGEASTPSDGTFEIPVDTDKKKVCLWIEHFRHTGRGVTTFTNPSPVQLGDIELEQSSRVEWAALVHIYEVVKTKPGEEERFAKVLQKLARPDDEAFILAIKSNPSVRLTFSQSCKKFDDGCGGMDAALMKAGFLEKPKGELQRMEWNMDEQGSLPPKPKNRAPPAAAKPAPAGTTSERP